MQFAMTLFLETKIEDKFFVLKSNNDRDKNKFLKKEIDLNFIQFHFEKECLALGNCFFNTSDLNFFTPFSIIFVISTNFLTNVNLL